ncbi:hypothetical protein IV102_34980 [bacterium]|nr:hypothetical protein [bacterium]
MSDRAWAAGPLPGPDTGCDQSVAVRGSSTSSLVALSRRRANQIVEQARLEAVEIRRQARDEGLQSGWSEMRQEQAQWLEESEARLQASLDGLIEHFQQATVGLQNDVRAQLGERLPQLVLLASGKAWAALLQAHPEALEISVKECLDTVFADHDGVVLSVNPGKLERMSRWTSIACQGDAQLAEGEFVIQSGLGQVKGSLEGRIQHLREALSLTPGSHRLGGF